MLDELVDEDGDVEDGDVEDGDVLDGYCELLLGVEDDDGVFWSDEDEDELVCANAPQHMPAAQRNVMILVRCFMMIFLLLRSVD